MQYIYIHGFGTTGAGSNKFKKINKWATEIGQKAFALEWNEHQDQIVERLIRQLTATLQYDDPVVLIGSSTGGNFALQLMDFFTHHQIPMRFILINPLIDVKQRKIHNASFTLLLADQLKLPKDNAIGGKIILGKQDEVLDYQFTVNVFQKNNDIILLDAGNHALSNISDVDFLSLLK